MKINYPKIGSISHGTLRKEDLIPSFIDALDEIKQQFIYCELGKEQEARQNHDRIENLCAAVEQRKLSDYGTEEDYFSSDDADSDLEDLTDLLNEFAPPFCYFGTHPGDGSDFGFWPMDIEEIKEQIDFCSTQKQEFPDSNFQGEWLHINERGNCTLFARANNKDKEIWSLV